MPRRMTRPCKYPVGATWTAKNENGTINIWLQSKTPFSQIWLWDFCYATGRGPFGWQGGDWATSYRGCYNMCAWKLSIDGKIPRFKRTK